MAVIYLFILCLILMLVGLLGVVLPVLPGVPLAWAGLLIFAAVTAFEKISLTTVLIFLGLSIIALVLDVVVPLLGAKKYKAGKYGVLGAFLGLIVGMPIFGFPGIILGPFLGAAAGELLSGRDLNQAGKSALGTLFGFLAGGLLKFILIFIMIGVLIFSLF